MENFTFISKSMRP